MVDRESLNFYKISSLLLDVGQTVLTERIKETCRNSGVSFETFLNKAVNKDTLFHLWKPVKCCNTCCSKSNSKSYLQDAQWNLLYQCNGAPTRGHLQYKNGRVCQFCLCTYTAVSGIQYDDLDITLSSCILLNICSLTLTEKTAIKNLREIRNNIFHPKNKTKITDTEFNKLKADIESHIMKISSFSGPTASAKMRTDIDHIINLPFIDAATLQELINEIQRRRGLEQCLQEDLLEYISRQNAESLHLGTCNSKTRKLLKILLTLTFLIFIGTAYCKSNLLGFIYSEIQPLLMVEKIWNLILPQEEDAVSSEVLNDTTVSNGYLVLETFLVSSFKNITKNFPVIAIAVRSDYTAWILTSYRKYLSRVDIQGNEKEYLVFTDEITDICITEDDTLYVALISKTLKRIKPGEKIYDKRWDDFLPLSVHVTKQNEMFVGLVDTLNYENLANASNRLVVHFNETGNVVKQYHVDDIGQRIFAFPMKILRVLDERLFVIDRTSNSESGMIMIKEKEKNWKKFVYRQPNDVVVNDLIDIHHYNRDTFIIADLQTKYLRLANGDGRLLYMLDSKFDNEFPNSLSVDGRGLIWVGSNKGTVHVLSM